MSNNLKNVNLDLSKEFELLNFLRKLIPGAVLIQGVNFNGKTNMLYTDLTIRLGVGFKKVLVQTHIDKLPSRILDYIWDTCIAEPVDIPSEYELRGYTAFTFN